MNIPAIISHVHPHGSAFEVQFTLTGTHHVTSPPKVLVIAGQSRRVESVLHVINGPYTWNVVINAPAPASGASIIVEF